jgi:hypothetical protein
MSKRKMLVFAISAISLVLLIALVGGGMAVWAAASNEQEAPPPQGKQEDERKEEEVPEIPEKIILRLNELQDVPYDERPFKLVHPEDVFCIGDLPPELPREIIVTIGKEECPEFPLVPAEPPTLLQLDELLEGLAALEEAPYDERPFKLLYPQRPLVLGDARPIGQEKELKAIDIARAHPLVREILDKGAVIIGAQYPTTVIYENGKYVLSLRYGEDKVEVHIRYKYKPGEVVLRDTAWIVLVNIAEERVERIKEHKAFFCEEANAFITSDRLIFKDR